MYTYVLNFLIAVDENNVDIVMSELEPVGKWYTGPVRPVEKCYRSGPAGNGPVGIIHPTGEIPVKTGEKVTTFLENNFLQKNDPKYEII
jgi:hypothetical protein